MLITSMMIGIWKKSNQNKLNTKDGKWRFFDKEGDTLYYEIWNEGKFIKQVPEQDESEVWKVELLYKDKPHDPDQTYTIDEVKQLEIKPSYKNSNKSKKLSIRLSNEFSFSNEKKTFTLEEFKNANLKSMVKKAEFSRGDGAKFEMEILDGKEVIATYRLKIRTNRNFFYYLLFCL